MSIRAHRLTAEFWVDARIARELDAVDLPNDVDSAFAEREERVFRIVPHPPSPTSARDESRFPGSLVPSAAALDERLGQSTADIIVWCRTGWPIGASVARILEVFERFAGVGLVYGDSISHDGARVRRPDFSPIRLRSQDYLGPVVAFRRSMIRSLGGFGAGTVPVAVLDLALRASAAGVGATVIPAVLAREVIAPDWDEHVEIAEVEVVASHLASLGISADIQAATPHRPRRLRYAAAGDPLVSVVIPTRGSSATVAGRERVLVLECVRGIIDRSTFQNFEFVIVADSVTPAGVVRELRSLVGARGRVVEWTAEFNFSGKMNRGIAAAQGEYVLCLNDDVELVADDSIAAMLGLAAQPGVGGVGAMLYFEDSSLQHAGHVYADGIPGHVAFRRPGGYDDGLGSLAVDREVSGATAACLLCPTEILLEVGAFSAEFPGNYNDVDLCLKLRSAGQSIVVTPHAKWYHFESKTRDPRVAPSELAALRARWARMIEVELYSPGLEAPAPA